MRALDQLEVDGRPVALARISLDLRGDAACPGASVVFALSVGTESLGSIAVPMAEIGVPLGYAEAKLREGSDEGYRLPSSIVDFIRSALDPDLPIYITFETPYGYLPGVPWERLGVEQLGRPVLRLGAAPVRPVRSDTRLDIGICCSFPAHEDVDREQVLADVISQIPTDVLREVWLHIFVDADFHTALRDRGGLVDLDTSIRFYRAEEAQLYLQSNPVESESNGIDVADRLEHPWLVWMRGALGNLSLDAVHFINAGYLGRSRPGLRFASSETPGLEDAGSRLIGSREINFFLEQVGAWAVTFSSPPGNSSPLGLRMLYSEVSRGLNVPSILHDIAADRASGDDAWARALREGYVHIFARGYSPPPNVPYSPALTVTSHPSWGTRSVGDALDIRMQKLLEDGSPQRLYRSLPAPQDIPSWVSAHQRRLEKTIAGIASMPEADRDSARDAGVLDALRFTSDLVAKYTAQSDDVSAVERVGEVGMVLTVFNAEAAATGATANDSWTL
ncbi:hypothetical protein [Variovorax arabinosiphilus]|uniref:hypothetical protein n=1 Tax=Variovorax arabinosiphilus TaxID=3053498 RepID=UPI0025785DFF|nr:MULTISPECIES: hypothetical protein [unclassified Variovorax]MDM0122586.1 hypothetical protein [Variovorax sp. J2L1-78]MDM0130885.1 hypothetical protein [Variovorax sp. J2L1-63]MDM0235349.1 hypothetical protein [Variovorax sp. J2R1-6]